MGHDVFISYSSKDKPWADAVASTLEANDVKCWIAPRDIPEGTEYPAALAAALRASRALVLIFSAESNESPQVQREVERTVALKIPLIPFRLETIPLSEGMEYLISTPQWLDADANEPERSITRLVPAVQKLLSSGPVTPIDRVVVPKLPRLVHAHRRLRQWQIGVALFLALTGISSGAYLYFTRAYYLIIMPLQNTSGQKEFDQYVTQFPLEIVLALQRLPESQLQTFPERDTLKAWSVSGMDSVQASQMLQVDNVLTAGFERRGDQLSFHAELSIPSKHHSKLIYPSAERPDEAVDPCLSDPSNRNRLLPLRRIILEAVLDNLNRKPSVRDRQRVLDPPTNSCQAYDLYVRARAEWNRRNGAGFRKAIALYKDAIKLDEHFALAYAGLADCYNLLADYSEVRPTDPDEGFPAAILYSDKALSLNGDLAEAHASKAFYLFQFKHDWAAAEEEFKLAFQSNARYASGLQWTAVFLSAMGRHEEAIDKITVAIKQDADSPILATNKGWLLRLAKRNDEAEKELQAVIRKMPDFEEAHRQLGDVYLVRKDYARALAQYSEARQYAIQHRSGTMEYDSLIARAHAFLGQRADAIQAAEQFKLKYAAEYFPASYIALIYIALDDKDAAFQWLDQSMKDKSDEMVLLKVDPAFDPLRGDPRFDALVKPLRFP